MGGVFQSAWWRVAVAGTALALVVAGALLAWRAASAPQLAESVAAEAARARGHAALLPVPDAATANRAKPLLVFVSGAVLNPGTYQLPRGSRVADAIAAAGGLLPEADGGRVPNLAGRLTDGKQVKVPRRGARSGSSVAPKLDLNGASVEELSAVPGIDPALAEAIVNERDGYGPFASLGELHTVLGLDTQFVSSLRPYLKVAPP